MTNLILIFTAIPILILLYIQWKIKGQQEQLIKTESESLKQLKENNQKFISADLFGLSPNCDYLRTPVTQSPIIKHREEILILKPKRNRTRKEYQVY
ncbi:hypothetical protein LZ575_07370 [Antarcticibacterium sp. 1MA-6-2]|uniref:hypothetical protein n=1 Tax=Antarcticibacterium sp. 1MA-6-2 TaxID=2908210 RepID=UPI001F4121CB|nr:hypothetical protein [Antarcticibacterium sp. 1MA-6-2]UJH92340.1 hypothetical protein LZ575_07370 [Antarcticibacterium sp. 1MA-6-2]